MNKVKEIFNGNKEDRTATSDSSHSHRDSGISSNNAGTGLDASTATVGHSSRTSTTGTTGSSGFTSGTHTGSHTGSTASNIASNVDHHAHSEVHSKPTLPGHRHNIENNADLGTATGEKTHDHKHLAAVTKETVHEHETEEVIREREHDRHVHHVQHHVQPVLDEQHRETQHHNLVHPVTEIREQHVNTDEDKKLFAGLKTHHDETRHAGKDRTVVDKGENVHENVHHHVHHVVQPVIERDVHTHATHHTVIPTKHVTHEAPIIHQSSTHEPLNIKDFVAQGGDLKSKLTHDQAGVLATGDCARDVKGPAEQLAEKLHLGTTQHTPGSGAAGTTGTPGVTSGTTGTTGTTTRTGNTL